MYACLYGMVGTEGWVSMNCLSFLFLFHFTTCVLYTCTFMYILDLTTLTHTTHHTHILHTLLSRTPLTSHTHHSSHSHPSHTHNTPLHTAPGIQFSKVLSLNSLLPSLHHSLLCYTSNTLSLVTVSRSLTHYKRYTHVQSVIQQAESI